MLYGMGSNASAMRDLLTLGWLVFVRGLRGAIYVTDVLIVLIPNGNMVDAIARMAIHS